MDPQLLQYVTFGVAMIGAVLGILNTWRAFDRDRAKLLVRSSRATPLGGAALLYPKVGFSIEVINRGSFALIVTEVGFMHRGSTNRAAVLMPVTLDGKGYPRKLDARDAVTFYMQVPPLQGPGPPNRVYARMACGLTFYGKGLALKA